MNSKEDAGEKEEKFATAKKDNIIEEDGSRQVSSKRTYSNVLSRN